MSTEKHTPTPWTASPDGSLILAPEGYQCLRGQIAIAELRMTNRLSGGDAAFIVRACNSHEAQQDALLSAQAALYRANDALAHYGETVEQRGEILLALEAARAALKLAKGE